MYLVKRGCRIKGFISKCIKLADILRVPDWRQALQRHCVTAAAEHAVALHSLGNHRTVVDVGANRGQFALVARRIFPEAQIISFEPLPEPAARFRAIFAADVRVSLLEAAIGPESGNLTIHISRHDDSSSLLPITQRQSDLFPGTAEAGTATIKAGPLHEFVKEEHIEVPALLKLDVQGFELEALRGCESLLHRFGHVYAECSFVELYSGQALADEVISWLRDRGFALTGIHNMVYSRAGQAIQGDFLFRSTADALRLAHSA
jgi:FkbM family methyltransferase